MKCIDTVSFSVLIAMVGGILLFLTELENVNAQLPENLTKVIEEKFPSNPYVQESYGKPVQVRYESPTSVILQGNLVYTFDFNTDLWRAMDLLKSQYGFKLQQIFTSGVGSRGNPTTVYILMTE